MNLNFLKSSNKKREVVFEVFREGDKDFISVFK